MYIFCNANKFFKQQQKCNSSKQVQHLVKHNSTVIRAKQASSWRPPQGSGGRMTAKTMCTY